jgi:hypothetical protein
MPLYRSTHRARRPLPGLRLSWPAERRLRLTDLVFDLGVDHLAFRYLVNYRFRLYSPTTNATVLGAVDNSQESRPSAAQGWPLQGSLAPACLVLGCIHVSVLGRLVACRTVSGDGVEVSMDCCRLRGSLATAGIGVGAARPPGDMVGS